MSTKRRWIAALLALSALTACAASAPHAARAVTAAPAQRVYVTGSHIAQPADPRTGLPEPGAPAQTVTHDDLDLSGQTDVGAALRQLLPVMH